ncbi:MAG TPA: carbamoyl-phosphate synthase large subunit, partial [Gammaproteobacteria bacterium]|nr:carbamoyl-phosphate synthase large subunit [Gammaproteobacteria bacterium]
LRHDYGLLPSYKRVDSVAGEFSVETAYLYSTYETHCESLPSNRDKIIVLGSGPNRIGQGIEFDYCCVHAAMAVQESGYEAIMVNCNPETVSTDYDTSDRLYFEPLTLEDVLEIVYLEKPKGVIVQYGGQTPLKLAKALELAGVPILGTSPDAIDRAEDRERFQQMIMRLGLKQPPNGTARTVEAGLEIAEKIGYPLIVRPSYVLGGRAMEIVHNETDLKNYFHHAVQVSESSPVLLDRFLDDATEVDVDAICDGQDVWVGGVLEHIEQAGVHSGDSACSLPPFSLDLKLQEGMRDQVRQMALELGVVGLINTQFAIQNNEIYILEVNPRAARTIPFVSKAIGLSLAKVAAKCMLGISLVEQGITCERIPDYFCVKKSVFPFDKFPEVDPLLGPEMRSTGEVMGIGRNFAQAFAKSDLSAGTGVRALGEALISVRDKDKAGVIPVARDLLLLGFRLVATRGTALALQGADIPCEMINKVTEGRPNIVDSIKNDKITFIVNTTEGRRAVKDSKSMRRYAVQHKVSYVTTLSGAKAMVLAMKNGRPEEVNSIQSLHLRVKFSQLPAPKGAGLKKPQVDQPKLEEGN